MDTKVQKLWRLEIKAQNLIKISKKNFQGVLISFTVVKNLRKKGFKNRSYDDENKQAGNGPSRRHI